MKAGDHLRLIIQQHPEETLAQHQARLAYRARNLNRRVPAARPAWHWILGAGLLAGIVLLLAVSSRAQSTNQNVNVARIGGTPQSGSTLNVNCLSGCSGAGGGGAAQLQVRNAGDSAWVNVGFNVANLTLPVTLQAGAATIGAISNTSFQVSNFPSTYDVSDRAARLLGHVTVDSAPTTPVTGTFWQATQPVSGTFWQATQPVSGTFWQATQPVSSSQLPAALDGSGFLKVHEQGTATVSGSVSVSNFPATQPVSGTVTANQGGAPWSQNLTQLNSVALGSPSAYGTSPGVVNVPGVNAFITNTATVTANAGSGQFNVTCTAANCPMNVAQFGGTNASTGTGASGAGIPRVTVANDSQVRALGNAGATLDAAPGAALPTNAQTIAGRDSSQTGGGVEIPVVCDKSAAITATAAASVVVIALAASKTTYICGFVITGAGAAGTMQWKSGTGTTCGTGTANLTGAMATAIGGTVSYGNGWGTVMRHASAAQDTCITMATASATAAGVVSFAQF